MKQEALLGIDAGTSSLKIAAYSIDGQLLSVQSKAISVEAFSKGIVEIDPQKYWNITLTNLESLISTGNFEVLGIGIAVTSPCVTFMDNNFNNVGNSITYLDNRAIKELKRYLMQFNNDDFKYFIKVGNRASISTCWSVSAKWVKENEPERWRKISHIGMLNSFLASQLTGNAAIDTTQASYSGLFKLANPVRWDDDLIKCSGIESHKLLDVVPPSLKIGTLKKDIARILGLSGQIPVAIGSGDTAAAAFGLGFSESNKAFESAGTSGVLSFVLDKPDFNPIFMNRCHIYPNKWLAHGATSLMGGAIDWLRNKIFIELENISNLDSISSRLKRGANGVVFLPYLSGERSPIWDPNAKSVWYGMHLNTNRYDLIEAVLEAGAFSLNNIKEHAVSSWGIEIESIVAIGNASRSSYWSQLKADVLKTPYFVYNVSDIAAYGAALMGGCAAGIFSGPEDNNIKPIKAGGKTYKPSKEEDKSLQSNYQIYKQLYPCLKDLMSQSLDL